MPAINAQDFCKRLINCATDYNTMYVSGCFGAPLIPSTIERYINKNSYNKKIENLIRKCAKDCDEHGKITFGFDCVCLVKGILWGWYGNEKHIYGGAVYKKNDIPDFGVNSLSKYCTGWSNNFDKIIPGEIVWLSGHCGVYVGSGNVVECTPKWDNKVQIRKLSDRNWTRHGKLNFINYNNYTATDYLKCKRIFLGTYTPTAEEFEKLDIDGDGEITARDYLMIKRIVNGTFEKGS